MKKGKGICIGSLPGETFQEKFELAKEAGFQGIEIGPLETEEERKKYKKAADKLGLELHSVMNSVHWSLPLSDPVSDIRQKSVEGLVRSIKTASDIGADTVLLVPAVVKKEVPYDVAYERSQTEIRRVIETAEGYDVLICIENVWNNFLLSPLEFARYVDEFESEYIQAYFDVGNIIVYGWPEHWIRILGKRIKKVHIKGFNADERRFTYLIEDCTIDWNAVIRALREIEYNGYLTAELPVNKSEPKGTVHQISEDIDKILAGL